MTGSDWIAYVGAFKFPEGEPASRRVYGIASALVAANYDVVVGSGDAEPLKLTALHQSANGRLLSYIGLSERPPKSASDTRKVAQWLIELGKRTVNWLDQQSTKPKAVIFYGASATMMFRLQSWCRKYGVSFVADVVDWHHPSTFSGGGWVSPFNISDKICKRFLASRADGIIAISSYLESYYGSRNCPSIRIPTLLDLAKFEVADSRQSYLNANLKLAYTGSPGAGKRAKDLINNVVEAVLLLNSRQLKIRFLIAGPTAQEIIDLPALRSRHISTLPPCLSALGWQSAEQSLNVVKSADFMPLLRPLTRVSAAGFPTKVAESLALGTPVVCNLTSDLGQYVHDGVEGLVCRDHSVEAFTEAIERALALSPTQYAKMRIAARTMAEQSFDYRAYAKPLRYFLEKID